MAQQSLKNSNPASTDPDQDNLVNMQDGAKEKKVLEINKQMSSLETAINKLNRQLNSTNKQVKTDVERLTESDAEITDKVAETYKQLGVIESTFQELNTQSSKINKDLKSINTTIRALEKETKAELGSAIENQAGINAGFTDIHTNLIGKAEKLSKKATSIAKKLDKSIKDNSKALADLEQRILTDLNSIAESSEQRDSALDDKISSQKARMLKMQSVDEALAKRAEALEATAEQLLNDSAQLKDSTNVLEILTSKLSTDVEALEAHTRELAEQNQAQQGQLDGLDERTDSLGRTLLALAKLEKKHFRVLGAGSLVLLIALLAAFFYGEYQRDTESAVEAQRNGIVNEQLSDLQHRVEDEQMASQVFYSEISQLEQTIDTMKGDLDGRLQAMTDQVDSMDGRIQYLAPLYNFGSSNTIHGSQWISQLNPEHKSIRIATVADKQELYDIAQRYNNHFTEELAYFMTEDGQYTLIYGGKFSSDRQLDDLLRRMPRYMNGQRIQSMSNAEVLQNVAR